jgi:RNA polymerase sigma factor (sigma-70 family)
MLPPEAQTSAFEAQRPRLLRLAYRMTGTYAEAEDVIQEAWIRWSRHAESVDNPGAWLTRVVTRLCLDRLRSARSRRETYIGPWLPEPLAETEDGPDADRLTFALMLALERLSPLERAAFLLHDVFGVPLAEVATILEREPSAVRQLASRARAHVREERPRYPLERSEVDRIAAAFFTAASEGNTDALRAMLLEDVVLHSDGGGRVSAFRRPIEGLQKVLRLYSRQAGKRNYSPVLLRALTIDGLPGFVSVDRGDILQATILDVREGRIAAIYVMRNPEKLRHIAAVLGL